MNRTRLASVLLVTAACAAHDAAFAQSSGSETTPKWDIEIHAGAGSSQNAATGSGVLPTTGTIVQGEISASTFYLGDGARLFNENQRVVAGTQAGSTIVPLDPVLLGPAIARERGPDFGARLQHAIKNRFEIQLDGDLTLDHLAFKPGALTAIETTRASYTTAVERALSASPLTSSVNSVATVTDHRLAPQLFGTGGLVVKLKTSGRTIPFVVGGGGVVLNAGNTPTATLVANYALDKPAQLLGTDSVTITYSEDSFTEVGFGGGGFTYDITPKWGIRLDAREYWYKNSGTTMLTVSPTLGFQSTGQPVPLVDVGSLKFATSAPLNGAPVTTSPTFTGSGLQGHFTLSAGFVLRF